MILQNLFRSYFARFMHPLAQAFVLSKILRGFLFCLPFWIYDIVLTSFVQGNFFFWDTIQLGSEHSYFFYENAFSTILLPDSMDSGHPPFFGMYIAAAWTFFGKSLAVSHWSMLPFLLGITWQSYKLGDKILGEWPSILFILILKINPIMSGQSVLISPDIVLVFFFLMALNAIFINQRVYLTIAIWGLSIISMRGMMTAAMLFIFQFIFKYVLTENTVQNTASKYNFKGIINLISPYLLGGVSALSFLVYHYITKGWVGYHAQSRWAEAFQVVNFQGFIKNIVVFGWRLIDNGHLFLWFILIYNFIKLKALSPFKNTRILFLLLIVSIIVLSPTLIVYKGLLQHRYLLPIYLILNLLSLKVISDMKISALRNNWYLVVFIGLFSGQFWIYPQPIATSWDTTLSPLTLLPFAK